MSLFSVPKLYTAIVISHPSKVCKSPYLVDVKVYDDDNNVIEENVMAHSPALGCCGMISAGAYVLCSAKASEEAKSKTKSKYIIHHVIDTSETRDGWAIGVNPMLANPIVKALLLNNKIAMFQDITELKGEVTVDESRFDFTFKNKEGKKVYLEVKNVPLADIIDVAAKDRKKINVEQLLTYDINKKIAIFPDGYRKNKAEPVSPRALKHVNHLARLCRENPDVICALVFLIQRNDVEYFKPSCLDPIYHKAVYDAVEAGVKVLPLCVTWNGSDCSFLKAVQLLDRDYKSI
jgi:DNA-binding sugar fermentation-stimulating protein